MGSWEPTYRPASAGGDTFNLAMNLALETYNVGGVNRTLTITIPGMDTRSFVAEYHQNGTTLGKNAIVIPYPVAPPPGRVYQVRDNSPYTPPTVPTTATITYSGVTGLWVHVVQYQDLYF